MFWLIGRVFVVPRVAATKQTSYGEGTRILADGVVVNAESGISPEELANEHFPGLGVERARRIIAFARQHAPHPA